MNTTQIVTIIGLVFIIIAWVVQIITLSGRSKSLNLYFVWLHLIGVLCIVIGNVGIKSLPATILSAVLAILAIIAILLYPSQREHQTQS
jgi:hypothetical protein